MRAGIILACIAAATVACTGQSIKAAEKGIRMSVFGFIEAVARTNLRNHADVETLLRQRMAMTDENNYYRIFKLDAVQIEPKLRATNVELREPLSGTDAKSGLLTMAVSGDCLQAHEVKSRYAEFDLIEAPRGRSPDEKTTYETRLGNTSVRFGFDQNSPSCLAELTFEQ